MVELGQCLVIAQLLKNEKVLPGLHTGFTLTVMLSCSVILTGFLQPALFGNHCLCYETGKFNLFEQISKLALRNIARELDALSVS